MYSGGFYPFESLEEYWAWWSRQILVNRYEKAPKPVYGDLLKLIKDKDYFVLTTNVDHQFQLAGFDKQRLFYTQGDYGLWQCSKPCHQETYDNEETVRKMFAEQRDMRIPTELVPRCPRCGRPMAMNLRCDDTFVQDAGWYAAARRYEDFLRRHRGRRLLFLELGVGDARICSRCTCGSRADLNSGSHTSCTSCPCRTRCTNRSRYTRRPLKTTRWHWRRRWTAATVRIFRIITCHKVFPLFVFLTILSF